MSSIGNINSVALSNVQGLDLESAMMAVQSQRANLLEAQLKDQISSVQAKNEQISKLNQALGALNKIAAQFGASASSSTKLSDTPAKDNDYQMEKDANSALASAGLQLSPNTKGRMNADGVTAKDSNGNTWFTGGVNGSSTKGDIDGMVQQLKSQIDGMSNSQQMDMLRLQSLSNKRNEAFETMTNFIKKMQDSRSAILGNMR